jgi:DNA-binding beta-propeller fold protein YncE
VSVWAATQTTIVSGLNSGVGVAVDESKMQLYYVEYNGGTLKRINLPPSCVMTGTPSCSSTVTTIASGFTHPEDVQMDMAHGLAYVTTRDDSGTTGALWRVNTATGIKSMVTFNLGAPQQLALDIANKQAYVVGYDDGRLRRINLYTGSKTPVFMGLAHPVGLAITKDAKFAYVTEQGV